MSQSEQTDSVAIDLGENSRLSVSFAPKVEEYAAYYQFIAQQYEERTRKSKLNTRRYLAFTLYLFAVVMVFIACALLAPSREQNKWFSGVAAGGMYWGLALFLYGWVSRLWHTRGGRVDSVIVASIREGVIDSELRDRVLILSEDGILQTGVMGDIRTPWSEVNRVLVHRDLILVFGPPTRTIFVPRRAFATLEACEIFIDFIQRHVRRDSSEHHVRQQIVSR